MEQGHLQEQEDLEMAAVEVIQGNQAKVLVQNLEENAVHANNTNGVALNMELGRNYEGTATHCRHSYWRRCGRNC